MAKVCANCGAENDDEAIYCSSCGQRLTVQEASAEPAAPTPSPPVAPPDTNTAPSKAAAEVPSAPPAPSVFSAEMGTGTYKHLLTDVYLRDSAGSLIMVAKRQSLLNHNYRVVDASGTTIGYFSQETHLTHRTRPVEDAGHKALGVVVLGNVQKRGSPPSCWLEDSSGNRVANLAFGLGVSGFTALKPDGSRLFEASFTTGTDAGQTLKDLGHKAYTVTLDDPGFPRIMVLATIAAIDEF